VGVINECEACGVVYMGRLGERLCPMCERERRLAMQRGYRRYYKERGWCYDCGRPAAPGKSRCEKCLEKHRNFYNKKKSLTCCRTSSSAKKNKNAVTVIISRRGRFDNGSRKSDDS